MKKPLKITQNHAKLSQEDSKKLTESVVFRDSKWLFISGPSHLAQAKKGKITPNQGGMVPGYLAS
jgi:hypothetical protein